MNKRDREQLRASIAKDLIEGQGEPSPTRELLMQYAPLEGIVRGPAWDETPHPRRAQPVEKTLAPRATVARNDNSAWHGATVARGANNKDDDDKKKRQSSSKGGKLARCIDPVENHSGAAAPRERQENADRHFALVRDAYENATGNTWSDSDSGAYEENGLEKVSAEKIVSAIAAVARRTPTKINSFRYFVREIMALPDPRSRAWQKTQLEKVVRRVRDSAVGRADYSPGDFVEDVKRACAREDVPFDNDLFSELAGCGSCHSRSTSI